jgi:hypothetical protein
MVQGQSKPKVHKTPSQPIAGPGSVPVNPATAGSINRRIAVQVGLGKE